MGRNNRALECSIGDRIGNFIVLRDEYIGKNRTWICECKCGAEKRFWKLSSISRQKSCGCLIDEVGLNGKQRRSMISRMCSYRSGARSRGLEWNLSYLDFVKVATGRCFYCNADPKKWDCASNAPSVRKDCPNVNPKDYEIRFNGIDRLNNKIGYLPDNVVPCCTKCNRAKSDMTFDEFLNHVEKMHTWLTLNRKNRAVYHGGLEG